jgi:hypothetical protein
MPAQRLAISDSTRFASELSELRRQLNRYSAEHALRSTHAANPGLIERRGVKSKVIDLADRTTEDIAAALHCVPPSIFVEVQSLHDRGLSRIDGATFVISLCPTRPVD